MRFCEDWVLANRMVFAANCVALVPGAMYLYRYHVGSLMSRIGAKRESLADAVRANAEMRQFLADNGLCRCSKLLSVCDWRFMGWLRLFSVERWGNQTELRLFGWLGLMRLTCNYKIVRKENK